MQLERWAIEDRLRNGRAARRRAKKWLSERGPTLTETGVFTIRCEGTLQYEILDPDGRMIAWMADGPRAALIVNLLNGIWPEELDRLDDPGRDVPPDRDMTDRDREGDRDGPRTPMPSLVAPQTSPQWDRPIRLRVARGARHHGQHRVADTSDTIYPAHTRGSRNDHARPLNH